jgi:hypothetical protein
MAKKTRRRRRSTSEKVMLVLGIIIALSMLVSLIAGLGTSGRDNNAPLPEGELFEQIHIEPVSAIDGDLPGLVYALAALSPPFI